MKNRSKSAAKAKLYYVMRLFRDPDTGQTRSERVDMRNRTFDNALELALEHKHAMVCPMGSTKAAHVVGGT